MTERRSEIDSYPCSNEVSVGSISKAGIGKAGSRVEVCSISSDCCIVTAVVVALVVVVVVSLCFSTITSESVLVMAFFLP